MRIVYVVPYALRVWTPEPYFFAKQMKRTGCEVAVIAGQGGDGISLFTSLGIAVHEMAGGVGWYRRVADCVRQVDPDIVHVFRHLGCGLLVRLARKGKQPRFVLDIRSPLLHGRLVNALIAAKDRLEFMMYDSVCSNTLDVMQETRAKGGFMHYLPNGVDPDEIPPPRECREVEGPFRFVYVGSVDSRRKTRRWLETFVRASRQMDIRLDLYGKGTDEELQALKQFIDRSGMSSRVRLLAAIPRRELFARLNRDYDAAIAYLPKKPFDTGPPLKTLECLACGLPVLVTDTMGNRLYVKHGLNGLIMEEDPDSVEQGILAMVDFVKAAENLRQICRDSVAGITWEDSISRHLMPLYQEMLVQ